MLRSVGLTNLPPSAVAHSEESRANVGRERGQCPSSASPLGQRSPTVRSERLATTALGDLEQEKEVCH